MVEHRWRGIVFGLAIAMACGACKSGDRDSGSAKVKTIEAKQFLKKMYAGARAYYLDTPSAGVVPAAKQFPGPSQGPTPPLGACCKNADRKCQPKASLWNHPVWNALSFSLSDRHYFSYSYEVQGDTVIVRAQGDLDCDGVYSTYEMFGGINKDYGDEPVSSGTVRHVRPLE